MTFFGLQLADIPEWRVRVMVAYRSRGSTSGTGIVDGSRPTYGQMRISGIVDRMDVLRRTTRAGFFPCWDKLEQGAKSILICASALLSYGASIDICQADSPVATELTAIAVKDEARNVALSPDGRLVAIRQAGPDGMQLWAVANHQLIYSKPEGDFSIGEHDLEFSPDGKWLASCSAGNLRIYDTVRGDAVHQVQWATGAPACEGVVFSADGKRLLSVRGVDFLVASSDVTAYEVPSWRVISTFRTEPYIAGTQSFSGIDACKEPLAKAEDRILLDPADDRLFFQVAPEAGFSLSADGRYLALAGYKGSLCKKRLSAVDPPFNDGRFYVAIVDLVRRAFVRLIEARTHSIDWEPSGHQLALGPEAGTLNGVSAGPIQVVNIPTGGVAVTEPTEEAHVHVRYVPTGKYLVESIGNKVEVWDRLHKHLLQTIQAEPTSVALSADGRFLALAGSPASFAGGISLTNLMAHSMEPGGKVVFYQLH